MSKSKPTRCASTDRLASANARTCAMRRLHIARNGTSGHMVRRALAKETWSTDAGEYLQVRRYKTRPAAGPTRSAKRPARLTRANGQPRAARSREPCIEPTRPMTIDTKTQAKAAAFADLIAAIEPGLRRRWLASPPSPAISVINSRHRPTHAVLSRSAERRGAFRLGPMTMPEDSIPCQLARTAPVSLPLTPSFTGWGP